MSPLIGRRAVGPRDQELGVIVDVAYGNDSFQLMVLGDDGRLIETEYHRVIVRPKDPGFARP